MDLTKIPLSNFEPKEPENSINDFVLFALPAVKFWLETVTGSCMW